MAWKPSRLQNTSCLSHSPCCSNPDIYRLAEFAWKPRNIQLNVWGNAVLCVCFLQLIPSWHKPALDSVVWVTLKATPTIQAIIINFVSFEAWKKADVCKTYTVCEEKTNCFKIQTNLKLSLGLHWYAFSVDFIDFLFNFISTQSLFSVLLHLSFRVLLRFAKKKSGKPFGTRVRNLQLSFLYRLHRLVRLLLADNCLPNRLPNRDLNFLSQN